MNYSTLCLLQKCVTATRFIHLQFESLPSVQIFFFSCHLFIRSLTSSISGFNQPLCVQTQSYVQHGNLRMTVSLGPQYSLLGCSAVVWLMKPFFLCSLAGARWVNEKTIWQRDRHYACKEMLTSGRKVPGLLWSDTVGPTELWGKFSKTNKH